MLRIKFWLIGVIVLGVMRAQAQDDSVFVNRGTIVIRKPGNEAYCKVQADYFIYTKGNGPKIGKLKNGLIYFKKDNRIMGESMPGNPRPVFIKGKVAKGKGDSIPTDIPEVNDAYLPEPDFSGYFTDTIHYSYEGKSPRYDTIQLRVSVDKKGKFSYRYGTKQDSLSIVGQKCMEALSTIKYWQPAYMTSARKRRGETVFKRKKAYSEIILTIVVSPDSFELSDPGIFEVNETDGEN
ncbi:MAG: hypothetical protein AB1458_15690 [Bacteroidota bacterium]